MTDTESTIYEEVFSLDNIKKVYENEVAGRGTAGMDGLAPHRFHKQRQKQFDIIHRKCIDGTYTFTPYQQVLKPKGPNKTPRVLSIPTVRDRIVLYIIKQQLHSQFDSCVNRKIPNQIVDEVSSYVRATKSNENVYRTDIKSFYGSVDHDILESKINQRVDSERLVNLIFRSLNTPTVPENYSRRNKSKYVPNKGVPQGLSISNILAEISLRGFDRLVSQRVDFYRRYVDDILVISNGDLTNVKGFIENDLKNRGDLELNCNKSYETSLSEEFQFLGYVFNDYNVTVRQRSIDRFIDTLAAQFTYLRDNVDEIKRKKYNVDESAIKLIFVNTINELLTGAIAEDRRYGWIFYYMEITDMELLHRIDSIVNDFYERSPHFNGTPDESKKIVRAYYEARNNPRGGYIKDYDSYNTLDDKREYLDARGFLDPSKSYSPEEIRLMFERKKEQNISRLKADTGTLS